MKGFAALLTLSSFVSSAFAAQTIAPMWECPGCSAVQMLTEAKNHPPGFAYSYDLAHNVVRKFLVFVDSTCATPPAISGGAGGGERVENDGGNSVDCGSFKDAEEQTPVDADVQNIFNSLHTVWVLNPPLASGKATRTDPVINPATSQPFNFPKMAWDWPSGEGQDLVEYVRDRALGDKLSANQFVPGLGDMIFGVSLKVDSVDIGSPPNVLTVHLAIDRTTKTIHMDICNANGDCAKLDIRVVNGAIDSVTYTGTYGSDNMQYPSHNGAAPGQGTGWHWRLGTDADHFSQQLHQASGLNIPARPGCGSDFHWGLTIARVNGVVDSATWQCVANN